MCRSCWVLLAESVLIALIGVPLWAADPPAQTVPQSGKEGSATPPDTTGGQGRRSSSSGRTVDYENIYNDLTSWHLWLTVLLAGVCGALGGLVYELVALQDRIKLPSRLPAVPTGQAANGDAPPGAQFWNLGFLARVLIGGLASISVLYFISPTTGIQLLALSIISGSVGMALFQALQARVEAMLKASQLAAAAQVHQAILDKSNEFKKILSPAAQGVAAAGTPSPSEAVAVLDQIGALAQEGLRVAGREPTSRSVAGSKDLRK